MPELSLAAWDVLALVTATCLISGLVRGFTGFGGPAIMVLVLTQLYTPASVLALVVLVDYAANLQLAPGAFRQTTWRATGPLIGASLLAMPIGIYALQVVDPVLLKRGIALLTGGCTCVLLANWRYRRQAGITISVVVGFISGALVGATFIALPLMIFFFAGPSPVAEARANAITWGLFGGSALIVLFFFSGLLVFEELWHIAFVTLLYMLGTHIGARAFKRASEEVVRRAVLISLLVLSVIGVST